MACPGLMAGGRGESGGVRRLVGDGLRVTVCLGCFAIRNTCGVSRKNCFSNPSPQNDFSNPFQGLQEVSLAEFGQVWVGFGTLLEHVWYSFGIVLGQFRYTFETIMGQCWDSSGTMLGQV